ncbi:MAG: heme lyase CcmF/NrfE family subunit [Solirubrobacteraceae bacterium]
MTAALGQFAATAGLALAAFGATASALGAGRCSPALVRCGRMAAVMLLPLALIGVAVLVTALLRHDFSFAYVAANGSRDTPAFYSAIGLWGSLEGSILLWVAVLAAFIAATALLGPRRAPDLFPVAQAVMLVVAAFFFWLIAGPASPFETISPAPADGRGPLPLLQNHPLMAIHPPLLYVGLVGFTVPFAFAIAALVTGRLDDRWIAVTRGATFVAWAFLALGIVLGGAWSYAVLGWGGYFAWDPVENVSLLPWFTATAFIHSVMVQEKRGMLKLWNLTLVVATFALTLLATFLTRSGVLSSVHAFAEGVVGPALLAFIGVVLAVSAGLLVWRGERLRSEGELDAPVCRESAFLLNNLLLVGITLTVLIGTLFPLLAEALDGSRLSVGEPYFNATAAPVMLALLFLMGVGPALPWRRASAAAVRRRLLWPAAGAVAGTAGELDTRIKAALQELARSR